jgi:integrase
VTPPNGRLGYRDLDAFGEWYTSHRLRTTGRPASPNTLRTKQVHIANACNRAGVSEPRALLDVLNDRHKVEALLADFASTMTTGAMRPVVFALLDFLDFGAATGRTSTTPALLRSDVPPRNPKPAISVYSAQEMEDFVTASRGVDVRWWAFITYLVDTGRRVGETLTLRWDHFRLGESPPYVELPVTKSGDPQYVPLTSRLVHEVFTEPHIQQMKQRPLQRSKSPHVGDHKLQPFPWSYNVARARFVRFCQRSGLPYKGFHCFRHTVITERLARGVPLQAVSKLAGHASVATTANRYDHTTSLTYARYIERP